MKMYKLKGKQSVVANTRENVSVLAENAELGGFLEMEDVPVVATIVASDEEEAKKLARHAEIYGEMECVGATEADKPEVEDIMYTQRKPLSL